MKTRLSPFLVGSFVVGGVVLAAIGLIFFRSLNLFDRPGKFVSYFNESVQGLDAGSPVRLQGVRVGRVASIQVHHDAQARLAQVTVIAELDRTAISDRAGRVIEVADASTLQRLVDEGLRARIGLAGITGLQFVELDFVDPREFPAPTREGPYPVVPTLPSGMSKMVGSLSEIATNLGNVDFAGLSRDLQSLLATLNRQAEGLDLPRMVVKVTAAAESIESLTGSREAQAAVANLNQAASDIQRLVVRLEAQVDPVRAELIPTLRSLHDAAEGVRSLVGPAGGLREEGILTLRQMSEAAESVRRLADFLERNPSSVITGRKRREGEP